MVVPADDKELEDTFYRHLELAIGLMSKPQHAASNVESWSMDSKLHLNAEKCK